MLNGIVLSRPAVAGRWFSEAPKIAETDHDSIFCMMEDERHINEVFDIRIESFSEMEEEEKDKIIYTITSK